MRTLLRTTLITSLITITVLIGWSLINRTNSAESANAASGLPVPTYCVPPELAGIQELLSKTTDPNARQILLAKEQDAENAALNCAANATAYPPAPKPTNEVGVFLPTPIPGSTPTLQPGIQHAELNPVGNFIPAEDGKNLWVGLLNGQVVELAVGSTRDDSGQVNPNLPAQGALRMTVNYDGLKGQTFPTPSRHGPVHLTAACGNVIVLLATDKTTFAFDIAHLAYLSNPSSCMSQTP